MVAKKFLVIGGHYMMMLMTKVNISRRTFTKHIQWSPLVSNVGGMDLVIEHNFGHEGKDATTERDYGLELDLVDYKVDPY
jgi:hypothetical protein